MEKVLIVTDKEKNAEYFIFMLKIVGVYKSVYVKTCKQAREMLLNEVFDLVLIDSPLKDELGKNLAIDTSKNSLTQVLLCLLPETMEKITNEVKDYPIITLEKPFQKDILLNNLNFIYKSNIKLKKMYLENQKLSKKIEDIKIIDRAKYLLITYLKMSEQEAHKYIEKEAMNTRLSKIEVAINILKTYER